MEMIINNELVKTLRAKKLLSQEELAIACGVGLRTIQRVEGQGQASPETIKALAAVLEVDSSVLLQAKIEPRARSSDYLNVQLGYVIIIVLIIITAGLTYLSNSQRLAPNNFLIAACILAVCAMMFATLTTQVIKDEVKWYLGLGFIRKTVRLSDIEAHCVVRNKVWWGFGFRLIPNGYLYNVSGLRAVEIKLNNGRVLRVGSDEPEAFNQAIHDAIARSSKQKGKDG